MFVPLTFVTMLVGLAAFVIKFFYPNFPFDQTQILAAVLFVLGLFGVYPQARARLLLTVDDLLHSLAFWVLVAGVLNYAVHYYLPNFPVIEADLLAVIVFVLYQFGIVPELRNKDLL
jgi:hypothetical protein